MMTNLKSDGVQGRELIAFRLGQQEFCLDVMNVREIRGWTPVTQLPHSPSYMLGVINLRGMVLPIIDLSARMGFPPAEPSTRHAIMVVELGKQVIGFLVDAVSEIFSGKDEDVQPTPDVASATTRTLIQGVIAAEGRMISVLSLDMIATTSDVMAA